MNDNNGKMTKFRNLDDIPDMTEEYNPFQNQNDDYADAEDVDYDSEIQSLPSPQQYQIPSKQTYQNNNPPPLPSEMNRRNGNQKSNYYSQNDDDDDDEQEIEEEDGIPQRSVPPNNQWASYPQQYPPQQQQYQKPQQQQQQSQYNHHQDYDDDDDWNSDNDNLPPLPYVSNTKTNSECIIVMFVCLFRILNNIKIKIKDNNPHKTITTRVTTTATRATTIITIRIRNHKIRI